MHDRVLDNHRLLVDYKLEILEHCLRPHQVMDHPNQYRKKERPEIKVTSCSILIVQIFTIY